MEITTNNEQQDEEGSRTNVVPFEGRRTEANLALAPEPFFTDAERREIREMLAYYRKTRPQFEAIKSSCPTARALFGNDD